MSTRKMNQVIISLGANLGDRIATIELAYLQIEKTCGRIKKKSSFYRTPPWGFESDQDFINSVIQVETKFSVKTLLKQLKRIEQELGRAEKTNKNSYEDRLIDIDILDFEQIILKSKSLIVPHSKMHLRNFVLIPLAEIEPDWRHPESLKTIEVIIAELPMNQTIERLNN